MLSPDVKPLGEEKANNTVTVHLLWNWLDILGCLEKPILILPPNVRSTRVYKGRIRYIGILMASVHQYKYIPKFLFMQIIFYWDIYLPRISCHHSILGLRKYTMLSWLTESITKDIIPIIVLEQFQTQNRIWSTKKGLQMKKLSSCWYATMKLANRNYEHNEGTMLSAQNRAVVWRDTSSREKSHQKATDVAMLWHEGNNLAYHISTSPMHDIKSSGKHTFDRLCKGNLNSANRGKLDNT